MAWGRGGPVASRLLSAPTSRGRGTPYGPYQNSNDQNGCGSKPMGSHFGVGAPPILEPILVGIGMFTGVRAFDRQPYLLMNWAMSLLGSQLKSGWWTRIPTIYYAHTYKNRLSLFHDLPSACHYYVLSIHKTHERTSNRNR